MKKEKLFWILTAALALVMGFVPELGSGLFTVLALPFTALGRMLRWLSLAGAVGNLIDRAFYGYVIDMFRTLFMEFAVFNVADICVVVGGIAAAAYYLFLYDKLEGKTNEQTDPDR